MTEEEKLIEALQKVALLADRLVTQAYPLQEQFNPETYEVDGQTLGELAMALTELEEAGEGQE